ncbi:hypothetical protein D3C80_988990 [compost metagenome]
MGDQRDRQAFATGTAGTAHAVHVLVTAARHVEVDHQVQAVDVQATGRNVGSHQYLGAALLEAVQGQLAVLLVLLAVQHEGLHVLGHQVAVDAVGQGAGVGEDDRLVEGFVGQQPLHDLLFVLVVVGGDDLLAGAFGQLRDAVEHQVLRVFQHLADDVAQGRATGGSREQQGLLAVFALFAQALHVFGKAHVEHAVGFVEDQHLHVGQVEVAGIELLEQAARGADQHVRHLAQHGGLFLEVFTAGNQARLDVGELREQLNLLEGLLGQLTGRQQDQRADLDAAFAQVDQAVEQRQHEGRGLAAAGLRGHAQVTPLQGQGDGRGLHRGWLDKFKLGHGFKQAFVQGELGEHGGNLRQVREIQLHRVTFSAALAEFLLATLSPSAL